MSFAPSDGLGMKEDTWVSSVAPLQSRVSLKRQRKKCQIYLMGGIVLRDYVALFWVVRMVADVRIRVMKKKINDSL